MNACEIVRIPQQNCPENLAGTKAMQFLSHHNERNPILRTHVSSNRRRWWLKDDESDEEQAHSKVEVIWMRSDVLGEACRGGQL